jgi:endonuclease-3
MTETDVKKKAQAIWRKLKKEQPDPKVALVYDTPFNLLVAVILSAQCTDQRVNIVTEKLFAKYKSPIDYMNSPPGALEKDIHSTGFFRNKAKNIRGMAKAFIEIHGGSLPETMDELIKLPGVGRKTANVILGECFGVPGIVVDTHVRRVSGRVGITENTDPVKIEFDLQKLILKKHWTHFAHALLLHGRYVCVARKPKCDQCSLTRQCNWFLSETGKENQKVRDRAKA